MARHDQVSLKNALGRILREALRAVDPHRAVASFLKREGRMLRAGENVCNLDGFRKVFFLGFGKAAQPMAFAVEEILRDRLDSGVAVVKNKGPQKLRNILLLEAGHPEPDERGAEAARRILEFAQSRLTPEDLLIVAVSGGGSALVPAPVEGVSLQDKRETTRALLRCGATIQEINAIRKHLSRIKGGRLLESTQGCAVLSLLLSDVVGDDIGSIASGPTSPDPTTFQDCLRIVDRYGLRPGLPASVVALLEKGISQAVPETPKPGAKRFERVQNHIVSSNIHALLAAKRQSEELGFRSLILSSSVHGNTADAARFNVAVAREILRSGNPVAPPCCILSGGETTLKVRGHGKGGRNQEFALWCAREIADWENASVLFASVGSDGCDGNTDAAGAMASPDTSRRADRLGLSIDEHLKNNDSHSFFEMLGDLVVTGETQTNVMDLQFILVDSGS